MSDKKDPNVYIIVLNWNGYEDTIECIRSLEQLHYQNYEIVVVDNASDDHSVENIRNAFVDIKILELNENRGYAAGNNAGIKYALNHNAQYIWILNNDTTVEKHSLQALVDRMEQKTTIGICGSLLIYYNQPDIIQALGGGYYNKWLGITRTFGHRAPVDKEYDTQKVEEKLDFIVGASMMVSRKFVESVGLMNEDYFLYYEELDWALRGDKSFELGFAPDSVVYHKHGVSVNQDLQSDQKRSKLAEYYQIKNRLKFSRRYYPVCFPTVYLTAIYALLDRAKKRQWERVKMILKLLISFNR